MKNYNTRSKMFGYQIGLHNDNLYVAVPKKYFTNGQVVKITCMDIEKTVLADDREHEATFKDKFKPDQNYTLYYFKIK